ncbi:MAG: hypothetical protein FD176_178 [Rhodospirillaceae bacterium]|nr:MAG: hypothetical protein FD176_178 [Rhodospirillaceae bacterium]TNC98696.1 MAG: hypothetical protein FD119_167 [Stygiobacter sp.]
MLLDCYPDILRQRHLSVRESCMAWGFTHGDGWFGIVDALLESVQVYAASAGLQPETAQIKEKMGGLRVYWEGADPFTFGAAMVAGEFAEKICELTGERGRPTTRGGCLQTLSRAKAAELGAVAPRLQLVRTVGKGACVPPDVAPVPEIDWDPPTAHQLVERYSAIVHGPISVLDGSLDLVHALLAGIASYNEHPVAITAISRVDGHLVVEHGGGDDYVDGAIVCAQAMARRVDPETGAIPIPEVWGQELVARKGRVPRGTLEDGGENA